MVYTNSFMVTTDIEAKEGRFVIMEDAKRAFLYTLQKYFTVIKFMNEEVDIPCEINPEYKEYVVMEVKNTNKVLYLIL